MVAVPGRPVDARAAVWPLSKRAVRVTEPSYSPALPVDAVLPTVAEMGEADRRTIAGGTPGAVLMEAAGRAVAQAVAVRWARRPVLVLAGPGNNGGDGYVAARHLRAAGWPVQVAALGDPERLDGDAARARDGWPEPVIGLAEAEIPPDGVVVDAVFGAGLTRPVEGIPASVLTAVGVAGVPVIAVDVPSGLDGDTGRPRGPVAKAAVTVTFFRPKPGHLLLPGRSLCGDLVLADIGIRADVLGPIRPATARTHPTLWAADWPLPVAVDAHKYARGHGAVWAGPGMTGAARLCAAAARRMGLGLVTVLGEPGSRGEILAAQPGLLFAGSQDWDIFVDDPRRTVMVLGPGGGTGPKLRAAVFAALATGRAVVLDADALTEFAADPETLFAAIDRSASPVVLTPHDGEYGRLFGRTEADRLARARAAAAHAGAVVLLKGADTVIAAPDGRAAINDTAPPSLATAGSGDVLAGMIAALMGQGMPGFEAAAAAAWLHGMAAARIGTGLIAEDVPAVLPDLLPLAGVAGVARQQAALSP